MNQQASVGVQIVQRHTFWIYVVAQLAVLDEPWIYIGLLCSSNLSVSLRFKILAILLYWLVLQNSMSWRRLLLAILNDSVFWNYQRHLLPFAELKIQNQRLFGIIQRWQSSSLYDLYDDMMIMNVSCVRHSFHIYERAISVDSFELCDVTEHLQSSCIWKATARDKTRVGWHETFSLTQQ